MSGIGVMPQETHRTFERLLRTAAERAPGRRVKMQDVSAIGVLARELHADEPDEALVEELSERLGLERADLDDVTTEEA